MIPLADIHCHLLAGLDDGPRTRDDAVAMCRMAHAEGVRLMAATAHQNERWRLSPEQIRQAAGQLHDDLRNAGVEVSVFPCAEVMAEPDTLAAWHEGRLLSMAGRGQYLLLEMPRGVCVDLIPTVRDLREAGLRPILAHPEREAELLHDPGRIEALIEAGSLVQVSSESVTSPKSREDARRLRSWFRRGIVHAAGSDGHSPRRRQPRLAAAYEQVVRWAGSAAADRIFSTNGMAILHGLPLDPPRPTPARQALWFLPRFLVSG
ncbi:MAG: ABATE domain-containing protein [Gemmataceae bacterium]|nr:ABATE domain-containing protein [Gemmataceae bacterium]